MTATSITGILTGSVAEDTLLQAEGQASLTPADSTESFFAGSFEGIYGNLTVTASGHWQYTLDNSFGGVQSLPGGATVHDLFVVSSGNSLSAVIDVLVQGSNDRASFQGDINTFLDINAADHLSGRVLVSDIDTGEKEILAAASMPGVVGTFSIASDGVWRYDLLPGKQILLIDERKSLVEVFKVVSKDGSSIDVSIRISTSNAQSTSTITGTDGADTLSSSAGIDTIDGGSGIDTVIYNDKWSAVTLIRTESGYTLSGGLDGSDSLINIERLQFTDVKVALDLGVGQAAGNIVRLLGAIAGSSSIQQHPDWIGIGIQLFDSGLSLLEVSDVIVKALKFSNSALIDTVYQNLVGSLPSATEHDNLVALLQGSGGSMSQAQLLQLAANHELTVTIIDLVGLQQSGVVFV